MKKFLKKIFAKKERKRVSRSPRVRLLLSDAIRFDTESGVFPVVNISETGMGLFCDEQNPLVDTKGILHLGEEEIPLEVELVRKHEGFWGVKFIGEGASIRSALRRHFMEEIHATEMTEVDSAHLAQASKGKPRWFYAPGNYELFFLEGPKGEIQELQMEWGGRVLHSSVNGGLRSGFLEEENRQKPAHARSNLVHWEGSFSEQDRLKGIRVIENVPGLDAVTRGKLVELLRR